MAARSTANIVIGQAVPLRDAGSRGDQDGAFQTPPALAATSRARRDAVETATGAAVQAHV